MIVLAIDCGFAATGVIIAEGDTILHHDTCRTERTAKKRGVRVADDDAERSQQLARFLLDVIGEWKPAGAVVELPSGGAQGARANRSMGMASGVVAAVLEATKTPAEWVTPQMVKKAATGRNDGSKEQVQAAVAEAFRWLKPLAGPKWAVEHVADAAAALLAARNGTLMRTLERMRGLAG